MNFARPVHRAPARLRISSGVIVVCVGLLHSYSMAQTARAPSAAPPLVAPPKSFTRIITQPLVFTGAPPAATSLAKVTTAMLEYTGPLTSLPPVKALPLVFTGTSVPLAKVTTQMLSFTGMPGGLPVTTAAELQFTGTSVPLPIKTTASLTFTGTAIVLPIITTLPLQFQAAN